MNAACRTVGILAICTAVVWVILRTPSRIERWCDRQAEATRALAATGLRGAVATLDARLASLERTADARLGSIERRADMRLAGLESLADRHLGVLVARADARVGEAIVEIGRLRADLRPVLASTDELLAQTSGTVAVLRPQLLGLSAAGKVTLGEWAQLSKRVDAAAPAFLADWARLTNHTAGIAGDAHTFTSKFVAPRSWKARLWDGFKTAAYVAGRVTP